MKKRIISSLLALVLVVSASAVVIADEVEMQTEYAGIGTFGVNPGTDPGNCGTDAPGFVRPVPPPLPCGSHPW